MNLIFHPIVVAEAHYGQIFFNLGNRFQIKGCHVRTIEWTIDNGVLMHTIAETQKLDRRLEIERCRFRPCLTVHLSGYQLPVRSILVSHNVRQHLL